MAPRFKLSISKVALFVILLAFLVRVGLLLVVFENPDRAIRRDSRSYLYPANNLLKGHGLSQQQEPPYTASALRTPTYPLFLASIIYILGDSPFSIATVQVLIDTAIVVIVYLVGRHLFSEPAALLGALLYAFSLVAAVHSVFILTETLFTFLVLCAVTMVIIYRSSERKLWLVAAGLFSGLAILCRPVGVLFPLVILIAIAVAHRKRVKTALVPATLYLFSTFLIVAPWLIRNDRLLGTPTLSTISNFNLLMHNAVALEADRNGISPDSARSEMFRKVNTEFVERGWTEDEARKSELYGDWGREIIASDPGRYLFLHLKSDVNSLLPAVADFLELLGVTEGAKGTLSVLNQHGIAAAVDHYFEGRAWLLLPLSPLVALLGLTYAGSGFGIVALVSGRRWFTLALLLLPLLYFLLVPGAPSNPRFRVPAMPYICLLAGLGIMSALGWFSAWRLARSGTASQEA